MGMNKFYKYLSVILLLTASILSCNLLTTKQSAKGIEITPSQTDLPVATVESLPLPATSVPSAGQITIVLTDSDVNEWIGQNMASPDSSPIENPVVRFTPGIVNLSGDIQSGLISTQAHLSIGVNVQNDGTLKFTISDFNIQGMTVPSSLRDQVESALNSAFSTYLEEISNQYYIESVEIKTGEMVIKAHNR